MMYSFPYVALIVFTGICAFFFEHTQKEEKQTQITIIAAVVFLLFFGFRGYVYTDWIAYTYLFNHIEWSDILQFDLSTKSGLEPGFLFLCMLCKTIFGSYILFNFTCAAIFLILLIRFCKQFNIGNIPFVLMLIIAMEGTGMILNLLRNSISIGIWLNSLVYIKERKPLPYFGLCVLALTFHFSSLVFFPLYFFLHKNTNKWMFLGLFIFFLGFYFSKISILLTIIRLFRLEDVLGLKLTIYTEVYTTARVFNPSGTLEKVSLALLIFLFYEEIVERFRNRYVIINSLLVYFFMYYFLGEFKIMSERASLLFLFARWILWVDVISVLVIENNRRILAGLLFLYCIYTTAQNMNQPILEYDNILLGAKTEEQRRHVFFKIVQDDE